MSDPVIDPTTGKPATPPGGEPKLISIPETEWAEMKGKLDVFDRLGSRLAEPAAAAPAAPSGPTLASQLADIDKQLEAIDDRIDVAISDQKSVKSLNRERDKLTSQRLRLQITHEDLNPMRTAGMSTLNQLSAEMTRGKMPHYELVKGDFDKILTGLPLEAQMNPETRQMVYRQACGMNIEKITSTEAEKLMRASATQQALDVTKSSRGKDKDGNEIPKPVDVLGAGAIAALREKGQTVEQYYQSRGYAGGWTEYYTKHKDYFASQGGDE